MRTLLATLVLLAAAGTAVYYAFPWWYLNNSKHVIMQPSALTTTAPVEAEGSPHKTDEPPRHLPEPSDAMQLMYFDEARETRISSGLKDMDLPLPVVRIGVGNQGDFRVAGLEVWMGDHPTRAVFERVCIDVLYTTWRMDPDLSEVDIWGVDRPDTKDRRGREVFSLLVPRAAFRASNPRRSRSEQVHQFGVMWVADPLP